MHLAETFWCGLGSMAHRKGVLAAHQCAGVGQGRPGSRLWRRRRTVVLLEFDGLGGDGKGGLRRGAGGPNGVCPADRDQCASCGVTRAVGTAEKGGAQPEASEAGGGRVCGPLRPAARTFEGLSARSVWPAWAQGLDTRTHLAGRPRVGPGGPVQAGLW